MTENRQPLPTLKKRLLGQTLTQLQDTLTALSQPKYRAKQVAEWLYKHRVADIDEMTNLPLSLRQALSEEYVVGRMPLVQRQVSIDGTEKYLFPVYGRPGFAIETVYIPEGDRATLCISSQVGCKMNCYFCQTGKMGFSSHLTAGDILNQLFSSPHFDRLTNVVYMGMGEPLDNYEEVAKSLEVLTASYGPAWSPKRITVSTIGPRKGLTAFLSEQQAHLAVSIHSPYSEERLSLMPVEKAFPIAEVIETLSQYDFSGQRRLSFEYIVFDNLNDSLRHAEALYRLLSPLDCRVNLIRYHSIPGVQLESPVQERVQAFEDYLNRRGLRCTTRRSRGEDIFAACGMLSTAEKEKKEKTSPSPSTSLPPKQ